MLCILDAEKRIQHGKYGSLQHFYRRSEKSEGPEMFSDTGLPGLRIGMMMEDFQIYR